MTTNETAYAEARARAARGELLGPQEMATIWCVGRSQFHALNAAGKFDFLKVSPAVGPRCFSGSKVHRWLEGEPIEAAPAPPADVFGRKRRA